MLLRRLGNKSKLAHKIQEYFPPHYAYIELFFGAGGMFFNKPKVKYNFLNDIADDIYNLFMVLKNNPDELYENVKNTPKHESLFKHWKVTDEADPVWKAVRFLYLSNYSLYGTGSTLRANLTNDKKTLIRDIWTHSEMIQDVTFFNSDFRDVIKKVGLSNRNDKGNTFIYADPPYLFTDDNYKGDYKKTDSLELFDMLDKSGIKYAVSEFKNDYVLDQADKRNLHVVEVLERRTMKNRNTEVLIMNYEPEGRLF